MVKMAGLKGRDLLICALSDWDSQQWVGTLPGWGWTPSVLWHHGSSGQNSFCMCSQMLKVFTSSGFWFFFFLLASRCQFDFFCDLLLIRGENYSRGPMAPWWRLACWGRGGFDSGCYKCSRILDCQKRLRDMVIWRGNGSRIGRRWCEMILTPVYGRPWGGCVHPQRREDPAEAPDHHPVQSWAAAYNEPGVYWRISHLCPEWLFKSIMDVWHSLALPCTL